MADHSDRFAFALKILDYRHWERFERLASSFVAGAYGELRTMASPSGDKGRDSQLFSTDDPVTFLQYSVTDDWATKIRDTVKKLIVEFPSMRILIYVTSRTIGALADDLKDQIRKTHKVALDIRDSSWFLENFRRDSSRERAAEELAMEVADPLLSKDGLLERRPSALTSPELRAAAVYLELQLISDENSKGLTRTSFEAHVRCVLRDTDKAHRLTKDQITVTIKNLLSVRTPKEIEAHVERALKNLCEKKESGTSVIHYWKSEDQYCLSNPEKLRYREHLIKEENQESILIDELRQSFALFGPIYGYKKLNAEVMDALVQKSREVIDAFLLERGEAFASALGTGNYNTLEFNDLKDLINKNLNAHNPFPKKIAAPVALLEKVVKETIVFPTEPIKRHLRNIVNSYTLLAFLKETPDVQGAINKMFSFGEIWLDTNIVLPILSERLFPASETDYTTLLSRAREAGLKFFITNGVLEEILIHLTNSINYERSPGSRSKVPFIYSIYSSVGKPKGSIRHWLLEIMGNEHGAEDLIDTLLEDYGIKIQSLDAETQKVELETRDAVRDAWTKIHEKRKDPQYYGVAIKKMAKHDTENYLGVMGRRTGQASAYGFTCWWLTSDRAAFNLRTYTDRAVVRLPYCPAMSPDFLTNYLELGPIRSKLQKNQTASLPIVLSKGMAEYTSPEILEKIDEIRDRYKDMPERRLRQIVRDVFDSAHKHLGELAYGGLEVIVEKAKELGKKK